MNITRASEITEETLSRLLKGEISPQTAKAAASLLNANIAHARLALNYAKMKGGEMKVLSLEESPKGTEQTALTSAQ